MIIETQIIKSKSELQSAITKLNVSKSKIYEGINSKSLDAVFADIKKSNGRQMTIIVIEGN